MSLPISVLLYSMVFTWHSYWNNLDCAGKRSFYNNRWIVGSQISLQLVKQPERCYMTERLCSRNLYLVLRYLEYFFGGSYSVGNHIDQKCMFISSFEKLEGINILHIHTNLFIFSNWRLLQHVEVLAFYMIYPAPWFTLHQPIASLMRRARAQTVISTP